MALDRAAKLVGRLAYNRAVKEAVRDAQVSASYTHLSPAIASALWVLLSHCIGDRNSCGGSVEPHCILQGINALVKLLQPSKDAGGSHLTETVAVAITILAINNELNQDAVRYELCLCQKCRPPAIALQLYCHVLYAEHLKPVFSGLDSKCNPHIEAVKH